MKLSQLIALCAVLGCAALGFAALAGAASALAQPSDDSEQFFSRQIEPLLQQRCYGCHSHAANEMGGDLTLDSRSGWEEGGSRGPAVLPGKAEESLLIRAVRRVDPDLQMPPDESLAAEEIALLVEWVTQGAPDPRTTVPAFPNKEEQADWWSLRPLVRPGVPVGVTPADSTLNEIDAFVERKLAAEGLAPAPRADRRTLIRRLYFDLHGLAPSPQEVHDFVADRDPLAYQKLVDRLLNSPRYGERWARHWLDTVHFADSHGCEHDVLRENAWRYRDYVIDSFNRDTPWDQFIREQIAADYFYSDQPQRTPALGFIAAGPLELSRAGTAPVTFDYLDRDDIVTQTMAAFASTTANCARCHDHKFDPISQEDYYALQAVFAGAGKGDLEFDADPAIGDQRQRWNTLRDAVTTGDRSILLSPENAALVAEWEASLGSEPALWVPLAPTTFLASEGTTLQRLDDHSLLASGHRPETDIYTITTTAPLPKITALRLDVLADDRLPMKGPGRQDNGNLHLNEIEVLVFDADAPEPFELKIAQATADWDQENWTVAHAIDDHPDTAWGIFPQVGQSHHAVFEFEEPRSLKPETQIVVRLKQTHGKGHLIGRLKLYATAAAAESAAVLPDLVRSALPLPPQQRSVEQQVAVASLALRQYAEQRLAQLPPPVSVYAWSTRYSHGKQIESPTLPKVVHVLRRGDIQQPGEVATPGALSVIDSLPGRFQLDNPNDERARRAALADWLASNDNPLTWRSAANRIWSYHFGQGLCDTPNDFGRMGGTPSHPELLDWLAIWLRDDAGGSLKQLHRLILLSATWQRESSLTAVSEAVSRNPREVDAQNRLLWRMTRRQMDAETYRDTIRLVTGQIDFRMGGPGVQQFAQSKGQQLTPQLNYEAYDWGHSSAARRSIYRVVWRGIADPFMESLDFPDLGLLAPKREPSVSALQALTVFNNRFVLHHSRLLAETLQSDHTSLEDQVTRAHLRILLRTPVESERALLTAYAQKHGLAATIRVLFNTNEFVFVD